MSEDDGVLIERFREATRSLLARSERADVHYSAGRAIARYTVAKYACVDAGIPLEEVARAVEGVIAECGGVGR